MFEIITPLFLSLIVGGTFIGIIFGAIPGMTATMAVAVCLPLTYSLGLENGLALLLGLYVGGISGGLRSAQELRQLIGNLGMVPVPGVVPVPFHWEKIEDGKLVVNEPMEQGLAGLFSELAKWGKALKPLHSAEVAAAA